MAEYVWRQIEWKSKCHFFAKRT